MTTYYLYDGGTPLLEETFSSPNATITAVNVWAVDGWRARYYPSIGEFRAFSFDPQGNVISRQNSTAAQYPTYDLASYEAYGKRTADYSPTGFNPAVNQDPVGFGGQYGYYTDRETGLLCLTHRYYDPGTGRFVNRDPIGYDGGVNLYGFAGGNPVNFADPSGFNPFNPNDTDFGVFGGHDFLNSKNVDYFAGWGSELSMGATDWAVDQLGASSQVNRHSKDYHNGELTGFVQGLAFGAAGAGRNAAMQMGKQGKLGVRLVRGAKRVVSDNRRWSSVRATWSRAAGGLANKGQSLHHWLIPQRARLVPQSIRNSGFNYLPLTASFNSWMNGTTTTRNVVEWGFKATAGSLYVSPIVYGVKHH